MQFSELKALVRSESQQFDFRTASDHVEKFVFDMQRAEFIPLVAQVGIIPEDIPHDSSEEKLFAKCADIVLAKAFQELGMHGGVNRERANCADVVARSTCHDYSLVGDAKAFRLSRTAKNQKDFKVKSMVDWRGDHDFAVLVCPYYQYPRATSQVFGQALNGRVLLFSWEHLAFLLDNDVVETDEFSLRDVWDLTRTLARGISVEDRDLSFLENQDRRICKYLDCGIESLEAYFAKCRREAIARGDIEIRYWENEIAAVRNMSREAAIEGLIEARKLNEKISSIRQFIAYLGARS